MKSFIILFYSWTKLVVLLKFELMKHCRSRVIICQNYHVQSQAIPHHCWWFLKVANMSMNNGSLVPTVREKQRHCSIIVIHHKWERTHQSIQTFVAHAFRIECMLPYHMWFHSNVSLSQIITSVDLSTCS